LAAVGNYSLDVYYRGADTVGGCEGAAWLQLDAVSCNTPSNAVCYTAQNNRYHQLKWGTDAANEAFSVNAIEFKFVPQGNY
jgi:hypothetical protein